MGATHSAAGARSSGGGDKSAAISSAPFVSTPREHDHWLAASAWRVLDDAYVSEWHRKNDFAVWAEKQKKQQQHSAKNTAAGSNATGGGRDEPSDFFEQVYAFLGPHYSGLQTHRLQAIVHEIAAACEAATSGKSMAFKREAFVRRIHLALEAHRNAQAAKAKSAATAAAAAAAAASASASASASTAVATTATPSTAVVVAPPNPLAPLYPVITPAEQEEELKDLPLSQQLSVRWLLSMLHALRPDAAFALDPASQAACTTLFLHQLLPLLDELSPIFSGGMEESKLGIMEEVEMFLARAFKRGALAITAAAADGVSSSSSTALVPVNSSSSSAPFPLAAVTSSLLSLAISRSKLSAMLVVLHPLLLAHARASAQPELRALESMSMQPQVLLKRIVSSDGPRLNAYLRGATQRRGSMSALAGAASKTGSLVAWGNGQSNGKLGLDQATSKKAPALVPQFESGRVVSVSAFQNHVLACDADMRVYGWGSNETHRLGFEDVNNRMVPTIVPFFSDKRVVHVATGNEFSAVLTADGTVWCFGDGQNNKLGQPASAPAASKVPVMVSGLGGHKVTAITCGGFHTLAMTASNELFAWGKNNKSVGHTGAVARAHA